jgi:hypothetical protein
MLKSKSRAHTEAVLYWFSLALRKFGQCCPQTTPPTASSPTSNLIIFYPMNQPRATCYPCAPALRPGKRMNHHGAPRGSDQYILSFLVEWASISRYPTCFCFVEAPQCPFMS